MPHLEHPHKQISASEIGGFDSASEISASGEAL